MLRALHITKGRGVIFNGGWGVLVIIILHLMFFVEET